MHMGCAFNRLLLTQKIGIKQAVTNEQKDLKTHVTDLIFTLSIMCANLGEQC